jgi:pSer/pThr/pTyr-binding forkhead associated (FHA) protein
LEGDVKGKRAKPGSKSDPTAFVGVVQSPGEEGLPPLETERTDALLIIVRGPNKGTEFAVCGDFVQIGRDPEMAVSLDDEDVSRRHAVIIRHRDRYFLRDCGSTNGTYLKGLFRGSERDLSPGDRFRIGETEFIFRLGKA